MSYENERILRDADGNPIPQYWDVSEQKFKPLTGKDGAQSIQVTGGDSCTSSYF